MTSDQKTREELIAGYLADMKPHLPPEVYAFIEAHEYDLALDREQAVYACRIEEWYLLEQGKSATLDFIKSEISWAEFVKDYGTYDTREEFHHGTEEEWAFEVKKADEWINLLTVWRDSIKDCASCPDTASMCKCFNPDGHLLMLGVGE